MAPVQRNMNRRQPRRSSLFVRSLISANPKSGSSFTALGVVVLLPAFMLGVPQVYKLLLGLLGLATMGTYFAPHAQGRWRRGWP